MDDDQRNPLIPTPEEHRASPHPTSRLAPAIRLVDLAAEIEAADQRLAATVNAKLEVIAAQMDQLRAEARRILEQAAVDQRLHHAACRFHKVIGRTYHLYEKDDGSLYFSMLSPADWGGAPPHRYRGAHRLRADASWQAVDEKGD